MLEPMRTRSKTPKASDEETRLAQRRQRNRQSAADSRERKKGVHDEMALELNALRAENAELRRLLGGGVSAVEYEGYTESSTPSSTRRLPMRSTIPRQAPRRRSEAAAARAEDRRAETESTRERAGRGGWGRGCCNQREGEG